MDASRTRLIHDAWSKRESDTKREGTADKARGGRGTEEDERGFFPFLDRGSCWLELEMCVCVCTLFHIPNPHSHEEK